MDLFPGMIEFKIRSGFLKSGLFYEVKNGHDLTNQQVKAGIKMRTRVSVPNVADWTESKVTPSRGKKYTEISLIKTNEDHRGTLKGGMAIKKLANHQLARHAKNGTNLKYWAMPLDHTGKGIQTQEKLQDTYKSVPRKFGFVHKSGRNTGLDSLTPRKA